MKISMGMIGMNMFNVQEKTWGYRFLRKSAMDAFKFSASADLGMSISKDFGFLSTSLMISNGEGYKSSSVDDNNKVIERDNFQEWTLEDTSNRFCSEVLDPEINNAFSSAWVLPLLEVRPIPQI